MKRLFLFLSQLLVFVGSSGLLPAEAVAAVPDTLNLYVIDKQMVSQFDGSQLVGKKIVAYRITTGTLTAGSSGKDIVRIHDIQTEAASTSSMHVLVAQTADPAYVIDGKQVSKEVFEQLKPSRIHSVEVVKNVSREDVKNYAGWENGVILVRTKKEGDPSVEAADGDSLKVITIRKTDAAK